MIVETARSGRLVLSMLGSITAAFALVWLGVWTGGLSAPVLALLALYASINAWTAWRLDTTHAPLLSLTPAGLLLHPALGPSHAIPWEQVRAVRVHRLRLWIMLPVARFATITLRDAALLPRPARWLPTGWFRALVIPIRFAADGRTAMARAAALAGAFQESDRQARLGCAAMPVEAPASGFDPDAALARYLARKSEPASEIPQPASESPQPALNGRPLPAAPRRSFGRKVA